MALALDLAGRVVLVTGGNRGVGLGISQAFVDAGATVITCSRSEADSVGAEHRVCDVRDAAGTTALVEGIVADHGRLDVLVNNAGGSPGADAATASPRFHAKIVELNLVAPLTLSQAAYAAMSRQDAGGSIVNISSVSGHRASPGTVAYGAAKAGLDSVTRTLAVEWAPKVRVNSIVVGMVLTEQSDLTYGDDASIAAIAATVPLGRFATPADIGAVAVFLASPLASYVTGSSIEVHGGGEAPAWFTALHRVRDESASFVTSQQEEA